MRNCSTLLTALLLLLSSCGKDVTESPMDAGMDADMLQERDQGTDVPAVDDFEPVERSQILTPVQAGIDTENGLEPSQPLAAGEVRLGRIEGDTGFRGTWSHCRQGDFKLYNSQVTFCIQGIETNRYEAYTGGGIVDAKFNEFEGEDPLDIIIPRIQFNLMTVDAELIVRDGSDGKQAVLRLEGSDQPIAHFVGLLGEAFGSSMRYRMITEYRLLPDSNHVEVVTWVRNGHPTRNQSPLAGDIVGYGNRMRAFVPGDGLTLVPSGSWQWDAGLGYGMSIGMAYHTHSVRAPALPFGELLPWLVQETASPRRLAPGEEIVLVRDVIVGDGTVDTVRARALERLGQEVPDLHTLTIEDDVGQPVPGRLVEIFEGDFAVSADFTTAQGEVDFRLAPGTYVARIHPASGIATIERTFEVTGGPIVLQIPPTGRIVARVVSEDGARPLTTRAVLSGPANAQFFTVHGSGTIDVAPGTWNLAITHGMEWEVHQQSVEVIAGETTQIDVSLRRVLDTTGWISGDFHQHMEPSIDSEVYVRDRVVDNVSQGVQIVASTDHEVVSDITPYVAELGFEDLLFPIVGVEISPVFAHVNLYPMARDPDRRGRGSIPLSVLDEDGNAVQQSVPEIIAFARQTPEEPVVQLNHPRNNSGFFNWVGYDPERPLSENENPNFTLQFDAMEIFNRYRDLCIQLRDWSGLLNEGLRVTGLGNSDTHGFNGESGQPRNYLRIEKSVAELEVRDVQEAIRNQRVTVSSYVLLEFTDGRLPGDTIEAQGAEASFGLRVSTPDWAEATTLYVMINGNVTQTISLDGISETIDFDDTITLTLEEDSWVVFLADGPQPSGVPYRRPVIGFTNPVWVRTSPAPWQAPGARPLDTGTVGTHICE